MKLWKSSMRTILAVAGAGAALTAAAVLLAAYLLSGAAAVLCGLVLTMLLFLWGAVFLRCTQKKLVQFTDSLCRTLDGMMDGGARPDAPEDVETLLARIEHRLERLYGVMEEGRRRVEEEKAELQALVSDISHQTKTPIANLKILNDTLLTRPVSEDKRRELLEAARSQLDKLDFLIQAMVKTSRLETGVVALERKRAPIADTLAAAINGVLVPLEKKGLTLSVVCPEEVYALHDSRWTAEALYNLLDNAVKYTPDGGQVRVTVQVWEMYVKIDVADTGRGIPEQEQAAVFRRFYREAAVHKIEGIGIGLYLAREIVSMQGGYIKVTSAAGAGATFSTFLPRT